MGENLPQKYKENIFRKLFSKLKGFFLKNTKEKKKDPAANIILKPEKENILNNKLEYLKVDIKFDDTEFKRKELMKNLSNNPDLLENFSNDKLEKILQWYLEENKKKKRMLQQVDS